MTVKDLILAHTAEEMYSVYLDMYYAEETDADTIQIQKEDDASCTGAMKNLYKKVLILCG